MEVVKMIFKDYYKILQLKTNKVSTHQIKLAYREQAKKYHPDVNVGNQATEERFKDINEAYKILSNPASKRKYDRQWYRYVGSKQEYKQQEQTSSSMKHDFFAMFFGQTRTNGIENKDIVEKKAKKKTGIRGEDVETGIEITLEEAFYGVTKKISLRTMKGDMKTFSVKIPSGIRDNEKIRLIGQGKAGKNGGKNGDLFIKVHIQDNAKFVLDGYHIRTELLITPWEAALGTETKLVGIDDEMMVQIPAGTQSGDTIQLSEKGYKDGKGGRGDLIADIKIMVPHQLTQKEKEIFEKMKQVSKFNPRIAM